MLHVYIGRHRVLLWNVLMLAGESWRSIIIEMCDCSSESPPPLGRARDPSVRTDTSQKVKVARLYVAT